MELWDLYNENREKITGKEHIRGNEIPDSCYHLVVHVWIKNSNGEFLISQRAADRKNAPLMWECVGGSVLKGEDSLSAALREVKEEVGIELAADKGKVLFTKVRKFVNGKKFNDILDVWLFEYDGDITLENATTNEVAQAKWMNKDEISDLFRNNLLVDTLSYFFDVL